MQPRTQRPLRVQLEIHFEFAIRPKDHKNAKEHGHKVEHNGINTDSKKSHDAEEQRIEDERSSREITPSITHYS